jgi:hypothetical protein
VWGEYGAKGGRAGEPFLVGWVRSTFSGPLQAVCRHLIERGPETLGSLVRTLVHEGDPLRDRHVRDGSEAEIELPPVPDYLGTDRRSETIRFRTRDRIGLLPFMAGNELQSALAALVMAGIVQVSQAPDPPPAKPTKPSKASKAAPIVEAKPSRPTPLLYSFQPAAVLLRLQHPRWLDWAGATFGPGGALIAEQMLCHQVLTWDEVEREARQRIDLMLGVIKEEAAREAERAKGMTEEELPKSKFAEGDVVAARLVRAATVGTDLTMEELKWAWDAMATSGSIVVAKGLSLPQELLAGQEYAVSATGAHYGTMGISFGPSSSKRSKPPRGVHAKHPRDSDDEDDVPGAKRAKISPESSQLWTYSLEPFLLRERDVKIARYVAERFPGKVDVSPEGLVVAAILDTAWEKGERRTEVDTSKAIVSKEMKETVMAGVNCWRKARLAGPGDPERRTPVRMMATVAVIEAAVPGDRDIESPVWQTLSQAQRILFGCEYGYLTGRPDGGDGGEPAVNVALLTQLVRMRNIEDWVEVRLVFGRSRVVVIWCICRRDSMTLPPVSSGCSTPAGCSKIALSETWRCSRSRKFALCSFGCTVRRSSPSARSLAGPTTPHPRWSTCGTR